MSPHNHTQPAAGRLSPRLGRRRQAQPSSANNASTLSYCVGPRAAQFSEAACASAGSTNSSSHHLRMGERSCGPDRLDDIADCLADSSGISLVDVLIIFVVSMVSL